ncbi:histidine phosphatase family protein [Solibacillus sp. CAU 1738]|uniref:histidine phosphatase family protein n=1 Tax=Solibacillus sp. CAU 1738 TaxID=3140363 RepID=UPI003261C160
MTIIGFIRHGVTAWNKEGRAQGSTDVPLDEEGINMAKRVATRIANEEWDIIYTSPLIRAKTTAEIIASKQPNLQLIIDKRLGEIGGGIIEGTTEEERVAKWGTDWRSLELGFEKPEAIIARSEAFIDEVKQAYPGKRVLVVSHGGLISRIVHHLLPNNNYSPDIGNTALTIIELTEQEALCHLYNCIEHLTIKQ